MTLCRPHLHDALARRGWPAPAHVAPGDLLGALQAADCVSASAAEAYLQAYHGLRFGGHGEAADLERHAAAIEAELEAAEMRAQAAAQSALAELEARRPAEPLGAGDPANRPGDPDNRSGDPVTHAGNRPGDPPNRSGDQVTDAGDPANHRSDPDDPGGNPIALAGADPRATSNSARGATPTPGTPPRPARRRALALLTLIGVGLAGLVVGAFTPSHPVGQRAVHALTGWYPPSEAASAGASPRDRGRRSDEQVELVEQGLAQLSQRPAPTAAEVLASTAARVRGAEPHAPLALDAGAGDASALHAAYAAFHARWLALRPTEALTLGVHPHPSAPQLPTAGRRLAELRLLDDLAGALDAWPRAALDAHARADLNALRAWTELQRRTPLDLDRRRLEAFGELTRALLSLAVFDCCPAAARGEVARAWIEGLRVAVPACVAELPQQPQAWVRFAVFDLRQLEALLTDYARLWEGASVDLSDALDATRRELERAREEFAARPFADRRELGRGAGWVALRLRAGGHDVEVSTLARALAFDHARTTRARRRLQRRLQRDAFEPPPPLAGDDYDAWLAALAELPGFPRPPSGSPSLVLDPRLDLWEGAAFDHLHPELRPEADHFHLRRDDLGPAQTSFWKLVRRGIARVHLALATTPGRHLQTAWSRQACALRRALHPAQAREGWAHYVATDVLAAPPLAGNDAATLAGLLLRETTAEAALIELLVACNAWTVDDLIALRDAKLIRNQEHLGEHSLDGLPHLDRWLGREAYAALRRAQPADADLASFHRELLAEGPLPPRFVR